MRHPKRVYNVIHSESFPTCFGMKKVRVCALTDPELYRLAKLNNEMPVRIEEHVTGNTWVRMEFCNSINEAQEWIDNYKKENEPLPENNLFDMEIDMEGCW